MQRLFSPVLIALIAALLLWSGVATFSQYLRTPLMLEGGAHELEVPRGSRFGQVVQQLADEGVLRHPWWLRGYARLTGRGHTIHAGDYLLGPGSTPLDLLDMLEHGNVRTWSVTLIEGWTLRQALAQLAQVPRLQRQLDGVDETGLLAALGIEEPPGRTPEGLFFPDTYLFSGRTADRDILLQAYHRMQAVLAEEWAGRSEGLPYADSYEALIMASIIERETGVPEERGRIAGVFVRRLKLGMRLQTDPTVIYGIGARFDGNLRQSDLRDVTNPYNTYAHGGLPPSPIALPGREAIRAALHPEPGDELFFVARGDGSHHFSRTLEEHQQAVRKYQIQQRRSDYQSRPQPNSAPAKERP
jgi:UPF0755 protein